MREIASGIIVFRRDGNAIRFLMLYRGEGYWTFPRGKLEQSERAWHAAFREVGEETGLRDVDLRIVGNFKTHEQFMFYREEKPVFKVVILYLAETKKRAITLSEEHEGYCWFTYGEAQKAIQRHKANLLGVLGKAHRFLMRKPISKQTQRFSGTRQAHVRRDRQGFSDRA